MHLPLKHNKDGSITVNYGPEKTEVVTEGNYIKMIPDRGWFQIIRCYLPTKGFFDKFWSLVEIELIKQVE